MGINPVTISARMNIPKTLATAVDDSSNAIKLTALPNLLDILKAYKEQIENDQKNGMTYTEEDLARIDKI